MNFVSQNRKVKRKQTKSQRLEKAKMSESQESTVNDYFVNMLELGSEATSPDLVYLSIPNLPSTYVFNLNNNFLGYISYCLLFQV